MGNIQTGRKGEEIACQHLIEHGVSIIGQNIQTPYGEIDILGKEEECFVFAEVKTRRNLVFGFPEQAVNEKKQAHMINSALSYLQENYSSDVEWRIDVIAIHISNNRLPKVRWFKNAVTC